MAAEVGYQAFDRDIRISVRHCGNGPDCELGHIRANLVGFFEVGLPMEARRRIKEKER